MPIARTVGEAQVGDLLWHHDPERSRYDENRKYLGRGVWGLTTVKQVRRQYLAAGNAEFSRDDGRMRSRSGYSSLPRVFGSHDRREAWWSGRQYELARAVKACTDRKALETIAFALGVEGPPDYSIEPPKEGDKP